MLFTAVSRICGKESHSIKDSIVKVQPFNRALGIPFGCDVSMPYDELVVPLDSYDKYKVRFLRQNKSYKSDLEDDLEAEHATVDWSQKPPVVECNVAKGQAGARQVQKRWKNRVCSVLQDTMDKLDVCDRNIDREYWTEMISELQSLNISDPNDICIIQEKENEKVVMVGRRDVMDKSWKEVDSAIDKAIKKVTESKEKVSKSEKLKPHQASYLAQSNFKKTKTSQFKNLHITIDTKQCEITVDGRRADVQKCLSDMFDILRKICEKRFEVESEHAKLLGNSHVHHEIGKKMRSCHLTDVWEVEKSEVSVYADTEDDLDKMENVITNALGKVTLNLDESSLKALKSDKWKQEERALTRKLRDCVQFKVDEKKMTLDVYILADNEDEVSDTLDHFCSKNAVYKENMTVDPPIAKFMENHMFKNILDKMDRLRDQGFEVKWIINPKGTVELQGKLYNTMYCCTVNSGYNKHNWTLKHCLLQFVIN